MKEFAITGKIRRYSRMGGRYLVYVNKTLSQRIKDSAHNRKRIAHQFVRMRAKIGQTSWNTALFPTKDGPYLLVVRADVRRKESIADGDTVRVSCTLL